MIDIEQDVYATFEGSTAHEWLETNGIGGYSSSTVSGANTRRYHGLLIAATAPPVGRMVLLSKFEETISIGDQTFELSCNQYPGTVHPKGYEYLTEFRLDPFPIWTYRIGEVEIEHSVVMLHGENTTVTQWRIMSAPTDLADAVSLKIKPLLAFRDHHHLRHEDPDIDRSYQLSEGLVTFQPFNSAPIFHLSHNAKAFDETGDWYRDLEYAIEYERGFDFTEDLFNPISLSFDLSSDAFVVASTERQNATDLKHLVQGEIARRKELVKNLKTKSPSVRTLVKAADQFIVKRGSGKTVIAGYHWFSDWGRDTMIALNGLTLATGRTDIAKDIIIEFSKHISQGMLPNRFPDEGHEPDYNTVDATLWYFEAVRAYIDAAGDAAILKLGLYEKLVDIIDHHIRGTRYGIHVDTDGLLYAGGSGTQLTWMDAKVGDILMTPRVGKPVEIQALWHNALCTMREFAASRKDDAAEKRYREMEAIAYESFNGQFWNSDEECLFDVVNGEEKDASIRPNQIFAVSLPNMLLDQSKARSVVKKIVSELLTPYGLRSLSPRDPKYIGRYEGDGFQRDSAYHQGTVWSWLIGHFIDAYRKVHSDDLRSRRRINEMLSGLTAHLNETMLGQVSEIFDGDAPHEPRGAAAQAWSVAELLRAITSNSPQK